MHDGSNERVHVPCPYFSGIANSKTEKLIHSEVDALIEKGMVTEQDLRDAESRIRKQSNIDVAYIATNPFKLVVSHKSIEKDEWAQVNSSKYAKGNPLHAKSSASVCARVYCVRAWIDRR